METVWKDKPDAYLSLTAPGFPNYFMTTGPQGPVGNGTILPAVSVILGALNSADTMTII
jgi:hypothetical protein